MKAANANLEKEWLAAFRGSIAPDLYAPSDIISVSKLETAAEGFRDAVLAIDASLRSVPLDAASLKKLLTLHPPLYQAICLILSIGAAVDLEDGRRLPDPKGLLTEVQIDEVAQILSDLEIHRLIDQPGSAQAMLRAALIQEDADRRRKRVDDKLTGEIEKIISDGLAAANLEPGFDFRSVSTQSLPLTLRRTVHSLIEVNGKPRIAIAYTFQAYSGGRQQRDFSTVYPSASLALDKMGIDLVLLADGQGVRTLSERILREVYRQIPAVMTLAQARGGELAEALLALKHPPTPKVVSSDALSRIIGTALETAGSIAASELPVPENEGRIALTRYASANPSRSLVLGQFSATLSWSRLQEVLAARQLREKFEPLAALELLGRLVGQTLDWETNQHGDPVARLPLPLEFQSGPLLTLATTSPPSDAVLRSTSKRSLQLLPASRIALAVVPGQISGEMQAQLLRAQTYLAVSVVLIDTALLVSMAEGIAPAEILKAAILAQTDLTRISPFVLRGVTPARVFKGRQQEEADLVGAIRTNSVAVLGGRRIGKTSLMRHVATQLKQNEIAPFFADCQVVQTWSDFGALVAREWDVQIPAEFLPEHLNEVVDQLRSRSGSPVVILLDEIDYLLEWDSAHGQDKVPEAFFRQCRAISQHGNAQFVFSGERRISQKFWDATSPHWNFCRPLMLRQLTRQAADALLADPLEGLGVRLDQKDTLLSKSWTVTDGHPELIQFLGDKLVAAVNERPREDTRVFVADVTSVAASTAFVEQYLTTYWGQSSELEKLVSLLVAHGYTTSGEIANALHSGGVKITDEQLRRSVRMIELYGIVDDGPDEISLRARWFSTALQSYGPLEDQIERAMESFR